MKNAKEILKAISERENALSKGDTMLLELEQKKIELVKQAVADLTNNLGTWPENYDEKNSDFVRMNEIDGVDFVKELKLDEKYEGLENEIEEELCDICCHCSIERFTVTFTQSSSDDGFYYTGRGEKRLNYLTYNDSVSSLDEALLMFEKVAIEKGICGSFWSVGYYGDVSPIATSEYLHPSLMAFQSDDKAALKKIERALLFIEIEKEFKDKCLYSYSYDEIFDLVGEELEISSIENNSDLKAGKLELVVTFENGKKIILGE